MLHLLARLPGVRLQVYADVLLVATWVHTFLGVVPRPFVDMVQLKLQVVVDDMLASFSLFRHAFWRLAFVVVGWFCLDALVRVDRDLCLVHTGLWVVAVVEALLVGLLLVVDLQTLRAPLTPELVEVVDFVTLAHLRGLEDALLAALGVVLVGSFGHHVRVVGTTVSRKWLQRSYLLFDSVLIHFVEVSIRNVAAAVARIVDARAEDFIGFILRQIRAVPHLQLLVNDLSLLAGHDQPLEQVWVQKVRTCLLVMELLIVVSEVNALVVGDVDRLVVGPVLPLIDLAALLIVAVQVQVGVGLVVFFFDFVVQLPVLVCSICPIGHV